MDGRWRQHAAASASPDASLALDIGTGTGDLALELAKHGARQIVGVAFSLEMLKTGRGKLAARGVMDASWTLADALLANAQRVTDTIAALVQPATQVVLLDAAVIPDIEFTAVDTLGNLHVELREHSVAL